MVVSQSNSPASDVQDPLLSKDSDVVEGNVDFKGRPAKRGKSGGWLSASFIIGVEMAEFFAYYGISANLITYLTGPLGQSTATAAENVNAWSGTSLILPLVGAFVADSFLGRYRTIVIASVLYILALGLLAVSAVLPSFLSLQSCGNESTNGSCSPPQIQIFTFYFSLYLVAIAQGMHKPCVHAFGADQFDGSDTKECKAKSSFFNWCAVGTCLSITFTLMILTYVQDYLSWGLGFGIPCLVMVFALVWFLLGTVTYRFQVSSMQTRPFSRIARVFVKAAKNWRRASSPSQSMDMESQDVPPFLGSQQFKFLNKALLAPEGSIEEGKFCSISDVEEAKAILSLFPIWLSCLVYGIVYSQPPTLFTKQGLTMDRFISSSFEVPAASLQSLSSFATIVFLSLYDRILVPTARSITGKPSGITMLQRIGTGIFFSILSISVAAMVESKRLGAAQEHRLAGLQNAVVPMSVAWLIPQYLLLGVSQSFTIAGLQEFFYDQVGSEMRSIGLALYFTIFGVGSLLSSILISVIESITGGAGQDPWFSDDPFKGHLDYFYWLLTVISAVAFAAFVCFAKGYTYRNQ